MALPRGWSDHRTRRECASCQSAYPGSGLLSARVTRGNLWRWALRISDIATGRCDEGNVRQKSLRDRIVRGIKVIQGEKEARSRAGWAGSLWR